ncbi:alpha/beta hydrolase [Marinoscillum sp.]|uniref:alpha/beta hydrolase n=1 Tax=Marinoscillum sp. TaxID=2024838 RepID=UPI003BACFEC1
MRHFLAAVFILTTCFLSAQSASDFQKKTVVYEDTLAMDVFTPKGAAEARPLLIYVHGGGFSGGKRDEAGHLAFCERYTSKGWVTATMSYHLTMKGKSFSCDQPVQNKINTIFEAARNIHQAVAYLIDRQTEFGIDPSRIVIVGSSAGAEAVVHAAYWKETMTGILPSNFEYAGVISMAGALLDARWITKETAIPTAFFHGTCDNLVPYGNAPHHYCDANETGFMMLAGSYTLAERLRSLDQQYYLVTDCGGGHEWASKPIQDEYIGMIDDFLESDVLNERHRQTHIIYQEGKRSCDSALSFCSQ